MNVQIEDILGAFEDWQEAKKQLAVCYKEADISPDYHCWRYAEKEKEAREKFSNAFTQFIDDRIEAATGARP